MRDDRNRHNLAAFPEVHDFDALGISADLADFVRRDSDNDAVVGDNHNIIVGVDHFQAHEFSGFLVEHARFDAHTRTALHAVFVGRGAFSEAVFGDCQNFFVFFDHCHIDGVVAGVQFHTAYALAVSAHCADVCLAEADTLAFVRRDDKFFIAFRDHCRDEFIPVNQPNRLFTGLSDAFKLG